MENRIFVTKSSVPSLTEYTEEIKDIFDTRLLTNMGKKHKELEDRLKDYLQVQNISLVTNGHMGLELALQALNLKGEVITTPFTFVSTTHAIVRNGLTPIFCDINKNDLTIDVEKIEELITDKTSAIMPVHVYGRICNVERIEQIAKQYNLKVIYDAAHVFGVKKNGKSILQYGDASVLSFHATKVFHTVEGGAIVYSKPELGKELYRLKNFGFMSEIEVDGIGANAKMDEFRAAMGICNLRHIQEYINKRRAVYNKYIEILGAYVGIHFLPMQSEVEHNYAYCPVIFDEKVLGVMRDEIYDFLKKNNVYTRRYFYPLVSDYECYNSKYNSIETPVAKYMSERVLCLPIYPDLEQETIEEICKLIIECIQNKY